MNRQDLELMRNEIYARHGWVFSRQDLRDYFSRLPWYRPKGDPSNKEQSNRLAQAEMNAIEKKNIQAISSHEKTLPIERSASAGSAQRAIDPEIRQILIAAGESPTLKFINRVEHPVKVY